MAIPIVLHNEITQSVINRYLTLSLNPENSEYGYSSYTRLFRGYIPFIEGSFADKIGGQGIGNLLSYIKHNPQTAFLSVTDYDPNWINSFQFILFSTGIIGAILFFRFLFSFYNKTSSLGKTLIYIYILALLSSGILLTPSSMIFLYAIYKESLNHVYSDFLIK